MHVWGAILWEGVGPLRQLVANLNAAKYQNDIIFDISNLCNVQKGAQQKRRIFQQDYAPAHSARSTSEFLAQKNVTVLSWPGNSPDFNPIEHAWADMARRVRRRGQPGSKEECGNGL